MKYKIFLFFLCIILPSYAVKDSVFKLSGNEVCREFVYNDGHFYSTKLMTGKNINFIDTISKEFSLKVNNKNYDGLNTVWTEFSHYSNVDSNRVTTYSFVLGNKSKVPFEVTVNYSMLPYGKIIKKNFSVKNISDSIISISNVDIESLNMNLDGACFSNFGRQIHFSSYYGDHDDALFIVHDYSKGGILFMNESPGVLKKVNYKNYKNDLHIGLSDETSKYPFRKYLNCNEEWQSPIVVSICYDNLLNPFSVFNEQYQNFLNDWSDYQIYTNKERRLTFMYNNFVPFYGNFNEEQMIEMIDAAYECGIKEFTIDCGWYTVGELTSDSLDWQNSCGDWIVDKRKFPNGLDRVFNYMRSKSIRPGLWVSLASVSDFSSVYKNHRDWCVLDVNGNPANIHNETAPYLKTMCFTTLWKEYIWEKLCEMIDKWGLEYLKLDLATVTSAYINDCTKSGCYSFNHEHKDREESFIMIYNEMFNLFDALHKKYPNLYIDCTFESEGKMQAIDLAFRKHADGNWLTNFEEPYPIGSLRIRNLAWLKSPAIPASSMLIGNRRLDTENAIEELRTMMGTFPILLGDLRNVDVDKRKEIKAWSNWIQYLRDEYDYDLYRSDLPGFGEPVEGAWDAFSRINTDTKKGGIIGVFRQGAPESVRRVTVPGLENESIYVIKGDPSSNFKEIEITGYELAKSGFDVNIMYSYGGIIFEIMKK